MGLSPPTGSDLMPSSKKTSSIPWSMAAIFLILTALVLVLGILYFENEKQSLEQTTLDQLNTVADLKIQLVSAWLNDRMGDAKMVFENPLFGQQAQLILKGFASEAIQQDLLTWMNTIHDKGSYKQVILLDGDGDFRLIVPQDSSLPPAGDFIKKLAAQAIATQQIVFSDFYTDPNTQQVFIDLLVPLGTRPSGKGDIPGTLVLRTDPHQFLYPMLQTWTYPGETSETFLVRQDGDRVVYLSDLRLRSDPPLSLSASITETQYTAVQAVQVERGSHPGLDYRGVPVLAATRKVAGTNWALVSKVDQAELDARRAQSEPIALGFMALLILTAGLSVGFIWRHREALFYKQQYQSEISSKALTEHLAYLTKYANDMILLMDDQWRIIQANDRSISAYGYTQSELYRLKLRDLQTEAQQSQFQRQVEDMRQRGGIVFETIHRRKDFSSFPVECSSRIIDVEGKVFYQTIIRDITERKSVEQELRESESRFRLFYEQAPVAYQSLSDDGCFIDVNRTWLKFMGYTKKQIIGRHFQEILDPDSKPKFDSAFANLKISGDLKGEEIAVIRADGSQIITAVFGRATYDEFGNVKQVYAILHDITGQKLAEEKIHRMNEDLEKRVLARTAQLEAANRELEAFSYSVSHDLRAPLRAIDGFSRILSDEYGQELSKDAQHYLERVRDNTRTMSSLIDNLLSFSRLSRQPLKKQPIDPTLLAHQCLDTLREGLDSRPIEINLQTLPPCEADPALLKQVFFNLLSNAIKFSSKNPKPTIEVGCLQENNESIYFVKDNGVGFDMQYAHKLFGVFQRLHRAEDYEGTGVGLAIVQRIIHRHGGRIWALSEPNQGATFCFTLEGAGNHG